MVVRFDQRPVYAALFPDLRRVRLGPDAYRLFSRIYTADLTLSFGDGLKAVCLCLFELVFLRFILAWVRCTAFIGYRKKKLSWGRIERRKIDLK